MWSEGIRTQVGVTDPFVAKAFNQSGGGFLNQTDLRAVLEKMGETVSEEELAALVRESDLDKYPGTYRRRR
jgi:Ca2+-binding EF-hand superfamily protein